MDCACIDLLTEKLIIRDLAHIVCEYVPKQSDEDIILAHLDTKGGSISFSKDDGCAYTCPVLGITMYVIRPKHTINVCLSRHHNKTIKVCYTKMTPEMEVFGYQNINLFDSFGKYNPTRIVEFTGGSILRYPEFETVMHLVCKNINEYFKSVLSSCRHVCDE